MSECSFRALIVDDEPISQKMLTFAFEQEGFHCDVAADGTQALVLFSDNRYDIVVTDLEMPRMNGRRLVRELLAADPNIRIVVHTSQVDPKVARELIAEGVDDIVFKPIDYVVFASKIWAILTRSVRDSATGATTATAIQGAGDTATSTVQGAPPPLLDRDREKIGNFQLRRRLGTGAMGEVYEAEQYPLGRPCAIKLMKAGLSTDAVARARFEREARAVAGLSHWNTVRVFDFGTTSHGRFYYAMELVPGESLEDIVSKTGPLPASRAIHLLRQVCDALNEAHQSGLIHRDLKPSNIMVTGTPDRYDVVKVVDFGLAKEYMCNNLAAATVLTQSGSLCGSPAYMAPEQILESVSLDHRVDIYALGITSFYLITGRLPFPEAAAVKTLMAHVHDAAPAPSALNPDVPMDLERVILKCLEKSPDHRYANVEELRQALSNCRCHAEWTPAMATRWWEQANRQRDPIHLPNEEADSTNSTPAQYVAMSPQNI